MRPLLLLLVLLVSSPAWAVEEAGERHLSIRVQAMPRDTNRHGTIHGGVLLTWMDQAGTVGVAAAVAERGWPAQPTVTVAIDDVRFLKPARVGDVLTYWTEVKEVGEKSMTVKVAVERDGETLMHGLLTYVSVRRDGEKIQAVPIRGE